MIGGRRILYYTGCLKIIEKTIFYTVPLLIAARIASRFCEAVAC